DQAAGEVVETGTAVGLGDVGVHQPDLPGLIDHVLGPGAVLVVLPGDVAHVFLGEAVGQLAQVLLLIGEVEIDHRSVLLFFAFLMKSAGAPPAGGVPLIDSSVNRSSRLADGAGDEEKSALRPDRGLAASTLLGWHFRWLFRRCRRAERCCSSRGSSAL